MSIDGKDYWVKSSDSIPQKIENHQFPVLIRMSSNMKYIENIRIVDPRYKKAFGLKTNGNGNYSALDVLEKGMRGKKIHVFDPQTGTLPEVPVSLVFADDVYVDREFYELRAFTPEFRGIPILELN